MGRFGLDFPLADFLTEAPDKAFLTGVTAGREVDTATIDGVPSAIWCFRNRQASNWSYGWRKTAGYRDD